MSSDPVAYTSDGYQVVINADKLNSTAAGLEDHQRNAFEAKQSLLSAIVPAAAFGSIPGGPEAAARLTQAMSAHIDAIERMGVSVVDLAARVKAAGQLAEEAEPVTAKVSRIPEPFESAGS